MAKGKITKKLKKRITAIALSLVTVATMSVSSIPIKATETDATLTDVNTTTEENNSESTTSIIIGNNLPMNTSVGDDGASVSIRKYLDSQNDTVQWSEYCTATGKEKRWDESSQRVVEGDLNIGGHSYYVAEDTSGASTIAYCIQGSMRGPSSSGVTYSENANGIYENYSGAEGDRRKWALVSVMKFGFGGKYADPNGDSWGNIYNADDGGTFGTYYTTEGIVRGIMVGGKVYPMSADEARVLTGLVTHSIADHTTVDSLRGKESGRDLLPAYNHIMGMANYTYSALAFNYNEPANIDTLAYVKPYQSFTWEILNPTTNNYEKYNNTDTLESKYADASGNVKLRVSYSSANMCNNFTGDDSNNLKTVKYSFESFKIGTDKEAHYYNYFDVIENPDNKVPFTVTYNKVSSRKVTTNTSWFADDMDPINNTARDFSYERDFFEQTADITFKFSDLNKDGKLSIGTKTEVGTSSSPFYDGSHYACKLFNSTGYQDMALVSSVKSVSATSSISADTSLGSLELIKKSADPDMTVDNDCYDLSGAEYYLYDRTDNNRVVAKFVTEETEQGKSAKGKITEAYYNPANVNTYVVTDLPLDHLYQLKEIKAPVNGYEIDSKTYDITLSSDNVETPYPAEVSDKAGNDPLTLEIIKADYEALDDAGKAKVDLDLAGTQFTVKYYDKQYNNIGEIPAGTQPTRTWVLKAIKGTDNTGKTVFKANFKSENKVSGDEFYTDTDGNPVIPYGSITVEETKATLGYDESQVVLTDEEGRPVSGNIYFRKIDGTDTPSAEWYITFNNKPTRSYLKFEKEDYETKEKLANVPFRITLIDTELDAQENLVPVKDASGNYVRLESHIVVTDANGVYDSELLNNKTNTNANDNAKFDNRGCMDGLNQTGIWFYGTAEEGHSEVYEDRGPFLAGMYMVEELRCSNNIGRQLIEPDFIIVNSEGKIDKGTYTNVPEPYISTVERDADTNSHYSVADGSVNLIDDVTYNYLTEGQKYTLWGILVDSSTRKPLLDKSGKMITATKSFTATGSSTESKQTANGTESMTFTFDGTGMDGKTFVVYEYLYKGENVTDYDFIKADGSLVTDKAGTKIHCLHTDVYSPEQTGYFPSVSTKAWDVRTKTNTLSADEIVEVADTVTLTNLMVGEKYELNATLINKETGEALKNEAGEVITGTYSFTADTTNDSQNVFFPKFKRSLIEDGGADLVIFEELIWKKDNGDVVYAQHKDINDTKQTLKYVNLETTATSNGDKVAPANETATIVDVVEYTNLIVGNEYELTGVLMVKSTNKPLLDKDGKEVSTTIKFKPEKANDKVEMVFTFDASLLQGESIVVFESLKDDSIEVATHNDISDDDQTVDFPSMGTSLVEKETGLPMGYLNENLTLVDTVSYEKFVVGKKYKITGILMNKDTGLPLMDSKTMKFVTGETEFTPTTENGTVNVEFTFNAYDVGIVKEDNTVSDIVCFEEAYYTVKNSEGKEEEVVFAYHKDLTSVSQTVQIPSGRTTAKDSTTGTHTGTPEEKAKIVDTVYYTNLIPNKTYRLEGKLWTKDKDGNAIPFLDNGKEVVSSVEFTPIEATGSIEMVFEFNASSLKNSGTTITVFEDCYYEDTEILVFTHSNIDDKDQQISYPSLTTEIKTKGGNKSLEPEKKYNLIDTITYEDLVVGETYVIEGVLMERVETRDTDGTVLSVSEKEYTNKDGNKSTAKVEFTPTEKDGKVDVSFEFYTSEDTYNKTFVCFERIYTKDTHTEVCDHTDINDAKQSFTVTDQVKTGDGPLGAIVVLMCLALAGIIFMITNKKKNGGIPLIKM